MNDWGFDVTGAVKRWGSNKGRDYCWEWLRQCNKIVVDRNRTPHLADELTKLEFELLKDGTFSSEYPKLNEDCTMALIYALNRVIRESRRDDLYQDENLIENEDDISEPVHSEEQLKEFAENSRKKYDLTQQQRAMETKLRSLKTQRLAASAAGDELEAKRIQRKINEQQTIYRRFSEKHDLLYDTQRASVEGYRRISAKLPTVSEKTSGNITPITNKSINSVKKINISGYDNQQCEIIKSKHKELLEFAKNNNASNECAFVLENDLSKQSRDFGVDDGLIFKDNDCLFMLYNRPNVFVMHNHPRNGSFSGRDIRFFFDNDNIKYFSIVKNNGSVEALTKTDKFDIIKAKKLYGRAIKKYVKIGNDSEFNKAIKTFLNNSQEMIEWIKG